MAEVTITGLPNAATLTGTERVPMDQAGSTVDASAQAIANLATAATVGLGNVNNTSDLNKPISTATQTALDLKAAASHTQAASTITGLKDQIGIACSDETTNLTASTSVAKVTLRMPYAMTLTQVRLNVGTAPTDSALIVNIKQGSTSIFSTRPQIDANAKTSVGSGTAAVFATTALTDDAEITIFVEQVGSTIAGSGLKVWLIGTRA